MNPDPNAAAFMTAYTMGDVTTTCPSCTTTTGKAGSLYNTVLFSVFMMLAAFWY